MHMKWNVFYYNINKRKIEIFNIFDHYSFDKEIKEFLLTITDKEEFSNKAKLSLLYYFWAKAEWEVIIAPWVGGDREKDAIKIDVYTQVMNNWDIFIDYCWNFRLE